MKTDVPGDVHYDHPQVTVPYRNSTVSVDEECAPLLEKLWARGFRTIGCCQDLGNGNARIWFVFTEQKNKFMEEHEGSVQGYLPHVVDFPRKHLGQ